MKISLKKLRTALAFCLVTAILILCGNVNDVNAASGAINVTSALTSEKLYSGDDLQEAFAAAERGSVITVVRSITLTQDVVLKAEVMLKGYSFIRFVPDLDNSSVYYQIKLAENGAIFCDSRIRTKYISALHSYSSVEMVQENGGYVYYLEAQAPEFTDEKPTFKAGEGVYGGKVDGEKGIIYLDVAPGGVTESAIAPCITMAAKNTERVSFAFRAAVAGGQQVATGSTMVATAKNDDYEGSDSRTYTVIVLGDVNGNGRIDSADAAMIAQFAAGKLSLTENALLAADANHDGVVNAKDAQLICQKYVRVDAYSSPLQA